MSFSLSKFLLALGVAGWIGNNGVAYGGQIIATPTGLQAGEQFRIVFVTDQLTDATHTDIQYYDNFVMTAANSVGGFSYQGQALTWEAIVSTASMSAISRLNDSAPLYMINGLQVAPTSGTTDFWDALYDPHTRPISESESGVVSGSISPIVWTGTYYTGLNSENYFGTILSNPLGTATPLYGRSTSGNYAWDSAGTISDSTLGAVYAFSDILTVGTASPVPEPSTFALLGLGGIVLAIGTYRRRRSVRAYQQR